MGRLTMKTKNLESVGIKYSQKDEDTYFEILNKLGEYEDAEEQGLLLRLPCKVRDKVYHVEDGYIYEFKAKSIDVRKENGGIIC